MDGRPFHLVADKCCLLAPGSAARIRNGYDNEDDHIRLEPPHAAPNSCFASTGFVFRSRIPL
ncbi:hypothetical protein [Paenibacillus dendritiformis]|uniref:hypothetical protein n=1 Tax=Paenibacillus dendritiformis TaxID=130049 RepID=UPI003B96A1F7